MSGMKARIIFIFLALACVLALALTAGNIAEHFRALSLPPEIIVAEGTNDVSFGVYYLENKVFDKSERPPHNHYLMSYTDYIDVKNTFSADFDATDISWKYTVTEKLHIKHQRGSDNNTNPLVNEQNTLVKSMEGRAADGYIYWDGSAEDQPGGVYRLEPKRHIKSYREFVERQLEQMERQEVVTRESHSFGAELLLEFTYHMRIGDAEEVLTRGVKVPLTIEVYDIDKTGESDFSISVPNSGFMAPHLFTTGLLVIWVALCSIGFAICIRGIIRDSDRYLREVKYLLKKYSDEISVSAHPLDVSERKPTRVIQFKELLKLAVNLNKQIVCFYDRVRADFIVFADGYAYYYRIDSGKAEPEQAGDFADYDRVPGTSPDVVSSCCQPGGETLSAGGFHTIGLKSDGRALITGCDTDWSGLAAVSGGFGYLLGLRSDGRVLSIGDNSAGQCNVSAWSEIVAVSAYVFSAGLRSNGTAVTTNPSIDVSGWREIKAISAGAFHVAGVKSNGKAVAAGDNTNGQCSVSRWRGITAVAAGNGYTVGLTENGRVVVAGNTSIRREMSSWRNISAISAWGHLVLGLRTDGSVIAVTGKYGYAPNVSYWRDIVAVSAGESHVVGLRSDGSVMASGSNAFGQCNASQWQGLMLPLPSEAVMV
ncbi:MAG: DUF5305 family protein [Oscillospiraceae bacterium]|nr:DUF5305 family protein [Oscillospiraceae bacterium]